MGSRSAFFVLAAVAWLGGCDNSMHAAPGKSIATRQVEAESARTRLDLARGRIWKLTSQGVVLQKPGEAAAIVFALPGWIVAGPTDACMPDLALGPKGELIVTSNVIPTLWRIDPESFAVTVHPVALEGENGRDVGFDTLAFSAPHGAFFALSHAHGAVWKINTTLTRGEKVLADARSAQSLERRATCATS